MLRQPHGRRSFGGALIALAAATTAIVAVAWAISVGEGATANYADISSAGPIEHVYLGDDLSC